jgi:TolB-like protein/Tfp pilus assembly protein PilF
MKNLLAELKRRRVFRVAAAYAIVAWLVIQIAATTFPYLGLPAWAVTLVIVLIALGLPVALVLAWAYDITPEGLVRAEPRAVSGDGTPVPASRWSVRAIAALGAVLVLALAGGAFGIFAGSAERAGEAVAGSTRSVAVLPFENNSADPNNAFFATGIHHEIITQLSKIADLHVISRSSVLRWAESERDPGSIAEALGVATIMEGSVQRDGNRVRIIARLVDASNGRPLWAQTYDRDISDVFAIQSAVALEIARQLNATLGAGERERIQQRATDRLPAYDLFLRAQQLYNTGMRENETAIELLKQATQIDPTFAAAHALLSRAYSQRVQAYGFAIEWADSAVTLGRKAVALNPALSDGHYAVAFAHSMLGRLHESDQGNRQATSLNPSDPTPNSSLARNARTLGQYDEAVRRGMRIASLDPLNPIGPHHVGTAFVYLGEWASAEQWLGKALEIQPAYRPARLAMIYLELFRGHAARARELASAWLEEDPQAFMALWAAGDVALHTGDYQGASRHFARLEQQAPGARHPVNYVSTTIALGIALHLSGDPRQAGPLLDRALTGTREEIARGHEAPGLRYEIALVSGMRADRGEACRWLERAVDAGWRLTTLTRTSPALRDLRGEQCFERLMARMEVDLGTQRARLEPKGS